MSQKITLLCDSPNCFNKIEWDPTVPESVPDTVHHWDTLVRSNKQELHFCSGECIIKWIAKRYVQLKGTKELAAEEQKHVDKILDFHKPVEKVDEFSNES